MSQNSTTAPVKKHKNLTKDKRIEIVALHKQGHNISQIARELKMGRGTVRKWIRRDSSLASLDDYPRPRAFIIERENMKQMIDIFHEIPKTRTEDFAKKFKCSARCVRNALHRAGLHHRRQTNRAIVHTEEQKTARLKFARDYRDFNFAHAIMSDEKSFRSGEHGRRIMWRVNSKYRDPESNENVRSVVINMWGWMCCEGPGELVLIDERPTSQTYLELLAEVMLPTVRTVYPQEELSKFTFFQKDSLMHCAQVVKKWCYRHPDMKTVTLPPRSPDLNPMENLWSIMVQRWNTRDERTRDGLIDHCNGVWDSLRGTDVCRNLVESMKSRCDAVIDMGGAATKYIN